jgi:hypothetical protein
METPAELRRDFYIYVVVTDSTPCYFGVSTSAVIPLIQCKNAADNFGADVDMYRFEHVLPKLVRFCGSFSA